MSQRNMKHRRRKRRYNRCNLFTVILFLAIVIVSASGFLLYGFNNTSRNSLIEEASIATAHNEIQATEELKDNVMEASYSGEQKGTKKNQNNTQNAGKDKPWNLMLVNKENSIPDNYNVNIVEVEGGEYVDERIYEPLMEMLNAAREGNRGELPIVVSGYRTQEKQQRLYDEKIEKFKKEGYSAKEAVKQAEQWVAVPGYSEHQLGFAVDINGATYDVYFWLQENSYKYGFIFRYPGSKTDITGTAEEVWHYRYVRKKAAKEIFERGICLEEYLKDF